MKLDYFYSFRSLCFFSVSLCVILLPDCRAQGQPCYIESLSSLPMGSRVAAFDDRASHISGCSLTYKSSTSVVAYVINLKSTGPNVISDKQSIVLNIDQTKLSSLLPSTKVVFVLSSTYPVEWDIKTRLLTLPRVLVSRPSTVRTFGNVDERVVEDLPIKQDELLEWVGKRHPVAMYAEISRANHIDVLIKQETHVNNNSSCVLSNAWEQSEISALFVEEIPIEGCILPQNCKNLGKEVYVIEHDGPPRETVTVNLQTVVQDTQAHNVVLVLRSSDLNVEWDVHGPHIKGSLEIQSNGNVNNDEVFETVATMKTLLDHSSDDLVKYMEKQYGGVVQYLYVGTANRVEITLEARRISRPPDFLFQDSSVVSKGNLLEQIIHTRCTNTSMVLAIALKTLNKSNMSISDIQLGDSGCNASTNDTHLIFKSDLGKCGMELKRLQKENVYVNEVYFNPSQKEKPDDNTNVELGSGVLPDDEDASYQQRSAVAEVQCHYPKNMPPQQDFPITFQMCSGPQCPEKALQFSIGTIYHDPDILATVRSCTVTSLDEAVVDHYVIKNGCAHPDVAVITRNANETVRIDSVPVNYSIELYEVACEVAICSLDKIEKHSQCPNRNTNMPCALQESAQSEFGTTYTIRLGPRLLRGRETQNPGRYAHTNVEETKPTTESTTTIVINGLSTIQVVGIAFAAFLMGIFFVAAIWYIHVHTAIPRGNEEQSSASQPPPYQPTSNGYAGYRQVPTASNAYGGNNGHMNGFGPTINPNGIPMNGMMNSADLAMV